jgi:hypothetical protein
VGEAGTIDLPESMIHFPWNSAWKQAREDSEQRGALEERFGWMTDADVPMLTMGLEPYPWEQFAEVIKGTQEWKFQAIEQRACTEHVHQMGVPPKPDSLVGAVLVIRSHAVVTVLKIVSYCGNASEDTALMLCRMAEALPERAQVDLIVSTDAVLAALGACADIMTKGWDADYYCRVQEWKNLMALWKDRQLNAVVRKVDEEGLDEGNSPFLKLALEEAIYAVRYTEEGGEIVLEDQEEFEGSEQ